jgi:hypothetical protein
MTIAEIRVRRRWMWLALPDDAEQCVNLARLLHATEHRQALELKYLLDCLRHECWDRRPTKRPVRPAQLRPSKEVVATGYRKSSDRHVEARQTRRAA